jgi:thymidylate synthase
LPQLLIHRIPESIDGFRFEDFEIIGYDAQPHIAAPIAV